MSQKTPYVRICVAIDVPTLSGNTFEAYQRLVGELQGFRFEWETTNEWYDAAGEPIPEHEVERIAAGPRENPMSDTGPIHWTGPRTTPGTDWLTYRTEIGGYTLTVKHAPGTDRFLWNALQGGRWIHHWDRVSHTLAGAQKAARDAMIDHADGLAEAARRIVSTIVPPEPT